MTKLPARGFKVRPSVQAKRAPAGNAMTGANLGGQQAPAAPRATRRHVVAMAAVGNKLAPVAMKASNPRHRDRTRGVGVGSGGIANPMGMGGYPSVPMP